MTRLVLDRLESGRARGELFLKLLLLQRKRSRFVLDLSDLLLPILQYEQLLQFRLHARMLWAVSEAVNRVADGDLAFVENGGI